MTAQDYTEYPAKAATELQTNMAEWLRGEEVGADPSSCKNKDAAFDLGVKLGVALRIQYQKSDFNQELRTAAAEERDAAKAKKAESKKAGKKAKEVVEATEDADEDTDEDTDEEEEAPKPAKKAGKKAPAKKAGKKAPAKKPAASEDDEDDDF